ncbi:GAF domain-containing protein [Prauserella halophila]|uniref:GAF domain-containing protein n=1 Tax=Prauserella halophila TaxID=185641 RepID=A0ABN1WKB7_9PSEU|nr:helix-turn-helix domain-containing protein [Prauserella halophila]MCP2237763.1 GAF domain-containing protein [Prauserella halophila]
MRSQPAPNALHSVSDPLAQQRVLQRIRDAALSDEEAGGADGRAAPRTLISESWRRSLATGVDPDGYLPPVVYDDDQLDEVRTSHQLHAVLPPLRELLVSIADEAQHITIVTDADGTILWREGPSELCRLADPVGLHEGMQWAETAIGTNAMGTALATDAPVQIYSAEHLVRTYHSWTCAAAPIHDPDTGRVLGAIDISGRLDTLHPAMVSLVNATAQVAENHLRQRMEHSDERLRRRNLSHLERLGGEPGALLTTSGRVIAANPLGTFPHRVSVEDGTDRIDVEGREALLEPLSGGYLLRLPREGGTTIPVRPAAPTLRLSFLGTTPEAQLDGRSVPLTLRRAEILALLALHPEGLTADQLALHLYGDAGNPTTVRAEVHRLRSELGEALLAKPYRLAAEADADFLRVRDALATGDVGRAATIATAPLLARSESPTIRAERDQRTVALRTAVLDSGDPEALWALSEGEPGHDDVEVFEHLTRVLPAGDPRRPVADARLAWLLDNDDD